MKDFLRHLFLPHHSNNHRARFLHHDSILFLIAFLLVGQLVFSIFKPFSNPLQGNGQLTSVLGIAFDINSEELLILTNNIRKKDGNSFLRLNNDLSKAALLKAKDMFSKNYWAHNAPDGITPWYFFKQIGYDYVYAGENLARGFRNSKDIIDAWMNSPSHRENMLSKNYDEVGFAVLEGNLLGEDTILVVEMLGNKNLKTLAKKEIINSETLKVADTSKVSQSLGQSEKLSVLTLSKKPLIDTSALSSNISIIILLMFISLLVLDIIIIERKKIQRIHGHTLDHVLYLSVILIIAFMFGKGVVL